MTESAPRTDPDDLFYGTRGTKTPRVLIVAESYGSKEEDKNMPLVGESGRELSRMLKEAGIAEHECLFTNVINERPFNNDMGRFFFTNEEVKQNGLHPTRGLFPYQKVLDGMDRLNELIRVTQPKIIFALGNYALWALADNCANISNVKKRKVPVGIINWRGSQLRDRMFGIPLVPLIHPAAILRQWSWRHVTIQDLHTRMNRLPNWDEPDRNFIVKPTLETTVEFLSGILALLEQGPVHIGTDIETRAFEIACIGLAISTDTALCIPFFTVDPERPSYWEAAEELIVLDLLWKVLRHPNALIIGQNFLYDAQYIYRYWGLKVHIAYDTRILQSVIYPGTPADLGYLSSLYCEHHAFWKEDGKTLAKDGDEIKHWEYNCRDCIKTLEIAAAQLKLIEYYRQHEQYAFQNDRLHMYLDMMIRGIRVDLQKRAELSGAMIEVASAYDAEFHNVIPPDVYRSPPKAKPWWRSPQQTQRLFYDVLGVKPVFNRKTGGLTADDEALTKIGEREPLLRWLTDMIAEYRSVTKAAEFLSTRIDYDGRMRCSYSPTTETYRSSSSKSVFGSGGNLQNLSVGSEEE